MTERLVKLEQIAAGIRRQFGKAGGQNDRQVAALGSDGVGKLRSRHEWHRLIGNDDVDLFLIEFCQRFAAVIGADDIVAIVFKIFGKNFTKKRLIIRNQNAQRSGEFAYGIVNFFLRCDVLRQRDQKCRTESFGAFDGKSSLMPFDDAVDHGQAKPGALFAFRCKKRIETFSLDFLAHANSGIGDFEQDAIVLRARAHCDCSAVRHGVDRVENQIGQRLAQLGGIARGGCDLMQIHGHVNFYTATERL